MAVADAAVPRIGSTRAYGLTNGGHLLPEFRQTIPNVPEKDVLQRDENGVPSEIEFEGCAEKIELKPIPLEHVVKFARQMHTKAGLHKAIIPQQYDDVMRVMRSTSYDASAVEIAVGVGIREPPSLTIAQFNQLVSAMYHSRVFNFNVLRVASLRVMHAYECFGWTVTSTKKRY